MTPITNTKLDIKLPPAYVVCAKVIFSVVFVSYSVCLHGHVQACSLGYSPALALTPNPLPSSNMFKLVDYAAHTFIGK